jgi:hypothetical protein
VIHLFQVLLATVRNGKRLKMLRLILRRGCRRRLDDFFPVRVGRGLIIIDLVTVVLGNTFRRN